MNTKIQNGHFNMKAKNPYLFITDMETSGFSPMKNDVVELAAIIAIRHDDGGFGRIATFHERCRPYGRKSWSTGSENVHGISFDEAVHFQPARKMLIKLLHFLLPYKSDENHPLKFICHAKGRYDYRFLEAAFNKEFLGSSFQKVFDKSNYESTHDLAVKYKDVYGWENLRLNTLCEYFEIELDHHRALSDTDACFELYKKLKRMAYQTDFLESEF